MKHLECNLRSCLQLLLKIVIDDVKTFETLLPLFILLFYQIMACLPTTLLEQPPKHPLASEIHPLQFTVVSHDRKSWQKFFNGKPVGPK